jgi:NTP pyrophosphatase (non-canonical NTP hydrolase)
MSEITHPELVAALAKPGQDIINDLTPLKAHCWHMSSALNGEAGELFDAIKKWVLYGKKPDRTNIVEEMGDIEFFLEGLRSALKISREETIQANIAKLSERYKSLSYSNEAAVQRADKAVE